MEVHDAFARFKCFTSPVTSASNISKPPPASICIPDAIDVGAAIGFRFAYTEPPAHANDESRITVPPIKLIFELPAAWPNPSLTNNPTPTSPMKIPSNTFPFGLRWLRPQLKTTIHKGSVAIKSAANPEATYFSAQVTP